MALSDLKVKTAKPKTKPFKLSDSGGLYIEVMPTGAKSWRLKYRFHGKEKRLALGLYPVVGLETARSKALEAKKLLDAGQDPGEAKKEARNAAQAALAPKIIPATFKDVALELFEQKRLRCTEDYVKNYQRSLELHAFPVFGDKPIADIGSIEIKEVCKAASKNGSYIPHKLAQRIGEVFDLAVSNELREYNPVSKATHKALAPHRERSFASITHDELPEFFKDFEKYRGFPITKLMLEFTLHTFLRTIEVRRLEWNMIDFDRKILEVPNGAALNRKTAPVVFLSKQVLDILRKAKEITGESQSGRVFPMFRDYSKMASENVLLQMLKGMGWKGEMTGHGFRALARTILEELGGFEKDVCELQLGHVIARNETEGAYRRVKFTEERSKMLQWWSDYLDERKSADKKSLTQTELT